METIPSHTTTSSSNNMWFYLTVGFIIVFAIFQIRTFLATMNKNQRKLKKLKLKLSNKGGI